MMEQGKAKAMALHGLRWLELQGLKVDHQKLLKPFGGVDQWWISAAGETTGPHPLRVALELLVAGTGSVQILHAAAADQDPAPWQSIAYRPLWLRKWPALAWTLGAWIVAALFGYAIGRALVPYHLRSAYALVYLLAVAALVGRNYLAARAKTRERVADVEGASVADEAPAT